MRIKLSRTTTHRPVAQRRTTHMQFSGDELTALARFVAAGRVLLQEQYPPVVARLKAAITRVKAVPPQGF